MRIGRCLKYSAERNGNAINIQEREEKTDSGGSSGFIRDYLIFHLSSGINSWLKISVVPLICWVSSAPQYSHLQSGKQMSVPNLCLVYSRCSPSVRSISFVTFPTSSYQNNTHTHINIWHIYIYIYFQNIYIPSTYIIYPQEWGKKLLSGGFSHVLIYCLFNLCSQALPTSLSCQSFLFYLWLVCCKDSALIALWESIRHSVTIFD